MRSKMKRSKTKRSKRVKRSSKKTRKSMEKLRSKILKKEKKINRGTKQIKKRTTKIKKRNKRNRKLRGGRQLAPFSGDFSTVEEGKVLRTVPPSVFFGEGGDKIIADPMSYQDAAQHGWGSQSVEMNKLKSDIAKQAEIIKKMQADKKTLEIDLILQRQLSEGFQGCVERLKRLPELMAENKLLKSENQRLKSKNQRLESDRELKGDKL